MLLQIRCKFDDILFRRDSVLCKCVVLLSKKKTLSLETRKNTHPYTHTHTVKSQRKISPGLI